MTLRSNHHFYLSGGTQSGKSTLAGVIINKIAAKSQTPAIVIGSDPKDDVTRWLCKFSRKFDGMKELRNWVIFATDQIDKQKARVSMPNGDTVNSSKNNQQSSQQQVDWYEEIRKWATELGRRPHFQEIKQKWHELTGQELNEKGVTLLLENLGYPDN